ncbi:GHMP kinase [Candidatus Latescibacterota bacterium]
MIISRTPFRVSFVGGGSDFSDFYNKNGTGAVISAAIQQYMYIVIHPYFHDKIRLKYSRTEDVNDVDAIKHPIFRECLKRVGIEKGIEIASFADISSGTGLGSSSSFTVGLLNALYAYKGKTISKSGLAAEACEIEIDILKEPIGKQDQYAASYGNLNHIRFNRDETVDVSPVLISGSVKIKLQKYLRLYYVGGQRKARDLLGEQKSKISSGTKNYEHLERMLSQVERFKQSLINNEITNLGSLLDEGWSYKKKLARGITNKTIDKLYEKSLKYGAKGGKLLGAGGTGFLLIFHEDHEYLSTRLDCRTLPFTIDREGSKIIFYE